MQFHFPDWSHSQNALIGTARIAAIDFESAGERRGEASLPIQVGMAVMEGMTLQPSSFFRSYLKTERPVTWTAQQVHGISKKDLENAPSLFSLWPEFEARLTNAFLVAHGRGTERRFLRAFPMHGFGPWIDTLTVSRNLLPGLASYALQDLIEQCGLEEELHSLLSNFRFHEALSDAVASLCLFRHLVQTAELLNLPVTSFIS